ncbi:MAG: protoheme IX farnesyltransferase [Ignavibacteriaceae bacterium]
MKERIKILLEITKFRITIFVTVTTMFGYISATNSMNTGMLLPVLGILLLACGSAALNHYQERSTDAQMDRTKNRPIPSGKISANAALQIAIVLVITGSVLLLVGSNLLALFLGLLNLIWYNVVYTPLKKVTSFAIVPGSLVGAIPPMVGWVAGGGYIFDPQIILISFFFFIWQIPHFWLLLMILDKDYQKAGFPTLTQIFNKEQLARITFMWITATGITGLLLPFFQVAQNTVVIYILLAATIWLTFNAFKLIRQTQENSSFRFAFRDINFFALFVVLIVSLDKLFVS